MKTSSVLILILVCAIVVSFAGDVYFSTNTRSVTSTATISTTVEVISQNILTHSTTFTTTRNLATIVMTSVQSVVVPCARIYPNGTVPSNEPSIYMQQNQSAFLCVRYFYYNSTAAETVNTSGILQVTGLRQINSTTSLSFNPSSNFTVVAFPTEITIGGPSNENEGIVVLYVINAHSNSSGTYSLGFLATVYPGIADCNSLSKIIVGNGEPHYDNNLRCSVPLADFYPLDSEGFAVGILTAEVVGISNSTS